jgi:hypothetical protein
MSTISSKIAKDILNLRKISFYKKFDEKFFINVPELSGYTFNFSHLKSPKVYLIINTNPKFNYSKKYIKIKDYNFIVYNSNNIEDFISEIFENLVDILEILKNITTEDKEVEEQKEGGLPYGYYEDKNGNVQVDTKEATQVRNIFKVYSNVRSIKKVAQQLGTNFSRVHDVLHDERYAKMGKIIVPQLDLKRVGNILAMNRKNKSVR